MIYHALKNSPLAESVHVPSTASERTTAALTNPAIEAESPRRADSVPRGFCLADATAHPVGEDAVFQPDTLVIYVDGGTVQWVGSDNAALRIFIADADIDASDPPVTCWEEGPRPLSELEESLREQVFGPTAAVSASPSLPSRSALAWADILPAEAARKAGEEAPPVKATESHPGNATAASLAAPDRDTFGWNLAYRDRQRLLQAQAALPATSHRSGSTTIQEHSCQVTLPNSQTCPVAYTRYNSRYHQFAYAAPLCQRVYTNDPLENSLAAIEQQAQERTLEAFQKAQQDEQEQMRRKTAPPGWKATSPSGETALRAKSAQEYAGLYAVCLRYASGQMTPIGAAYERPGPAQRELMSGVHNQKTLHNGQALVIGICNRWARRWQEPRFLATGAPPPSASPESPQKKPVPSFPPSLP